MTKDELLQLSARQPSADIYALTKKNWDAISKPIDGLGDFEDLVCRIAAIQGTTNPVVSRRRLVVCCADNGVVEEGVTQCDKAATLAVAEALSRGKSSVCRLAESCGVDVCALDVGIDSDRRFTELDLSILDRRVANGTKNFLREPAIEESIALAAIGVGVDYARELVRKEDVQALAVGEMGIGNTTTASATLCALLGLNPAEIVGRGAGLDDEGLDRKRAVVCAGLEKYDFNAITDNRLRAFEILRTLGGLDIAAMTGLFLGAAIEGIPAIIDGCVSAVAALFAETLLPGAREFAIASHQGREKGLSVVLNALQLKPLLLGNMAFGEGTGAVMLFPLLDATLNLYRKGLRFDDLAIEQYERFEPCSR